MTIDELADLLQKTPDSIYQMRYLGGGPPAIRLGRSLRWRREDVEAWMDRMKE